MSSVSFFFSFPASSGLFANWTTGEVRPSGGPADNNTRGLAEETGPGGNGLTGPKAASLDHWELGNRVSGRSTRGTLGISLLRASPPRSEERVWNGVSAARVRPLGNSDFPDLIAVARVK